MAQGVTGEKSGCRRTNCRTCVPGSTAVTIDLRFGCVVPFGLIILEGPLKERIMTYTHTRRLVLSITGLLIFFSAAQHSLFPQDSTADTTGRRQIIPKGVVAMVNGKPITTERLDREITRISLGYADRGTELGADVVRQMRGEVLEELIDKEVLYQEAQRLGLVVSDSEVQEQIMTMRTAFDSDMEFEAALARQEYTEKILFQELKEAFTVERLLDVRVREKVVITPEDARNYYEKNPSMFVTPLVVRASHILIGVEEGASTETKAAAREKLAGILEQIRNGADFEQMAIEHSTDPSAERGGDLGYFERGQMVREFEEIAFNMQPGALSGIVETRFGFHIIKVTDRREPEKLSYEDVETDLIEFMREKKARFDVLAYVELMRSEADITLY
jgi:peptidyl-prolyl cis-trans isomerase C